MERAVEHVPSPGVFFYPLLDLSRERGVRAQADFDLTLPAASEQRAGLLFANVLVETDVHDEVLRLIAEHPIDYPDVVRFLPCQTPVPQVGRPMPAPLAQRFVYAVS